MLEAIFYLHRVMISIARSCHFGLSITRVTLEERSYLGAMRYPSSTGLKRSHAPNTPRKCIILFICTDMYIGHPGSDSLYINIHTNLLLNISDLLVVIHDWEIRHSWPSLRVLALGQVAEERVMFVPTKIRRIARRPTHPGVTHRYKLGTRSRGSGTEE